MLFAQLTPLEWISLAGVIITCILGMGGWMYKLHKELTIISVDVAKNNESNKSIKEMQERMYDEINQLRLDLYGK